MSQTRKSMLAALVVIGVAVVASIAGAAPNSQRVPFMTKQTVHHFHGLLARSAAQAPPPEGPPLNGSPPGSVAPDVTNAFPAFARGRNAADGLGASELTAVAGDAQERGTNPALSRMVLNSASAKVWLLPGAGYLCMVVALPATSSTMAVTSTGCSADTSAEQHGMMFAAGMTAVGVLPSGSSNVTATTTNGTTESGQSNSEGAFAITGNHPISTFTYTQPNRVVQALPVAGPPTTVGPPGPSAPGP